MAILDELVTVSVDLIEPHPENPRIGNVGKIKESLTSLEQFSPLVVQQSTGYILSGNHTYAAAVEMGWDEIIVVYLDVDDVHARRIMLAANKIADLGTYNEQMLGSLIASILEEGDDYLDGTGYDSDDIDDLLDAALDFDFEPYGDEGDAESIQTTATALERMFPTEDEDEEGDDDDENDRDEAIVTSSSDRSTNTVGVTPTDFVIFRFGELRAKVSRSAYEQFVRGFLKQFDGDLSVAGVEAACLVGLAPEDVEPAVVRGSERWL